MPQRGGPDQPANSGDIRIALYAPPFAPPDNTLKLIAERKSR